MTEPTDAELEALLVDKAPILALVGANVRTAVVKAMREAFGKWGTQPAVAGKAAFDVRVGTLPTMTQDEYPGLGDWWVQLRLGPDFDHVLARVYGASPDEARWRAFTIAARLGAATQAQAGAVPLTEDQREALWESHGPTRVKWGHWEWHQQGIEDAERHHGIKGGQHGAE